MILPKITTGSGHQQKLPKPVFFRKASLLAGLLGLIAFSFAFSPPGPPPAIPLPKDHFAAKAKIQHARGFSIQYFPTYKVVSIFSPFEKTIDTARYVLVQRGTPRPKGYASSQVIAIPIRSLVAMSSLHVGLVGFLGAEDVLVGLADLKYVSSPKVIARISAGKIAEVGDGPALNEEKLIAMHPDLVMLVGSPTAREKQYRTLNEGGVPTLVNSEWIETTPLGRAEWVKLLAALLNKEAVANQQFGQVEREYSRLTGLTRKVARKPSLISGMNYKDAWFVPNGQSYMATFFRDAGGAYPWGNTRATGSLPLNFEAVYPVALKADYWLNVSLSNQASKREVLAKDVRYADFKAFRSGQIYDYNQRTNSRGSNDFWESGVVHPDWVLADLIRILHPELVPNHALVYYRQIK